MLCSTESIFPTNYNTTVIICFCCRIRGKLGSLLVLSVNIGILLGFIAGHYLPFFTVPKCAMWFPVINFATLIFFPESPIHLLRKNKLNDAVNALQIYRNSRTISKQNSDFYQTELDKLITTKDDSGSESKITWKDFRMFAVNRTSQ